MSRNGELPRWLRRGALTCWEDVTGLVIGYMLLAAIAAGGGWLVAYHG